MTTSNTVSCRIDVVKPHPGSREEDYYTLLSEPRRAPPGADIAGDPFALIADAIRKGLSVRKQRSGIYPVSILRPVCELLCALPAEGPCGPWFERPSSPPASEPPARARARCVGRAAPGLRVKPLDVPRASGRPRRHETERETLLFV